jgi:transposase
VPAVLEGRKWGQRWLAGLTSVPFWCCEPVLKPDAGSRGWSPGLLLRAREANSYVLFGSHPRRPPPGTTLPTKGGLAVAIDVVVARAAGLDIAKASLVACVRTPKPDGSWKIEKRKFVTTTRGVLELVQWLTERGVTRVGMESTSDYWKPVYYVLESVIECWLLNARHMHAVPGRKTDMIDAEWICDLVAHGLVRPSFVPPAPIRRLRDLTRRRTILLADRTREKQRMEKLLEDAGVKLSVFVTDIFGRSGRAMIDALIRGERDGTVLAELALGRMRSKVAALAEALTGRFSEHHAFMAKMITAHIDMITAMVADLDTRIDAEIAPYQRQIELLDTINGVDIRTAQVIIAETGADMSHFTTAGHLASWAGICPGNNKTGGKAKSGHTRPGNRWLKNALGTAALGAIRTKDSYTNTQFRRVAARRGGKRALTAVAHSLLVTAWHLLATDTPYQDLGSDYFTKRQNPDHHHRKAIATLERLGYHVTLEPLAA